MKDDVVNVAVLVEAPIDKVWDALVNPEVVPKYMFGASVKSEWRKGASIVWTGEWQGKAFEDNGVITDMQPQRRLQYTHYSPLSGLPDVPESYHTVTIDLAQEGGRVRVALSQDGNATEEAREHSERNWTAMLASFKQVVEGGSPP
jgi:uncharacterized protein YndB with AHSA1/START domain